VIPDIKFCVEYNGLMFHPKEGDTEWKGLYTNQSYDEKLNYDKQKMKTLTDAGFTTMVVWEDEDETIMVKKITEKIVDLLSLSI
jgi:G:T-mismatch repair DNA endonuclease (very short patch repair protein)